MPRIGAMLLAGMIMSALAVSAETDPGTYVLTSVKNKRSRR